MGPTRILPEESFEIMREHFGVCLRHAHHQQARLARQAKTGDRDGLSLARDAERGTVVSRNATYGFAAGDSFC